MTLKNVLIRTDPNFTGKRFDGVGFHPILQTISSECKCTSALIAAEKLLPSSVWEVCLTDNCYASVALERSSASDGLPIDLSMGHGVLSMEFGWPRFM